MDRKTALVVIDRQLGIYETPGLPPVANGEGLLGNVERLIRGAREAGAPVTPVRHGEGPGVSLERGTEGWGIHPRVAPKEGEPIVDKETPDSFLRTTLSDELERRGIERLVLAGMQTEFCVDTTCRRAFGLGYGVTLAADAHGTWDTEHLPAAQDVAHHNEVMGSGFAEVVPTAEVRFVDPVRA